MFPITIIRAQDLPSQCVNSRVRYGISPLPGDTIEWILNKDEGKIMKAYRDSVEVLWGSIAGRYSISYIERNPYGCSTQGIGYVDVNPLPKIDLGTTKNICIGNSLTLDAGTGFKSYKWSTNNDTLPTLVVNSPGQYWVEVTNEYGCVNRDTVTVTVNDLPNVNLGPDIEICAPNTVPLDAGFWASYRWSKGNGNSSTLVAEEGDGTIWVEVTDEYGCVGADTIQILQCITAGDVPNAFTPNGDEYNSVWHIGKLERFPNFVVKVYDRWGRLVFTSAKGYPKPWDGTYNGKPLPMDTYYYVINYGDGSKERVGSVAIIR